jgi:mRNA interferase MazF
VTLPEGSVLTGVVMVEQVKSVDYVSRRGKRIEAASNELLAEVLSILDACLY